MKNNIEKLIKESQKKLTTISEETGIAIQLCRDIIKG